MTKSFRPNLVPPSHRQVETEGRRSCLCLGLSLAVTLLVFVVFGVSGWNLYRHRFSLNTLEYVQEVAVNDVSDDFSSTFCQSYKVSTSTKGVLYLLQGHASVNTSYKDTFKFTRPDVFRKLFLLKGSEMNISACRKYDDLHDGRSEMVLVKGSEDYRNYKRNHRCHSCISVTLPLCQNHHKSKSESKARLNYTVPSNDFYYLILAFRYDNRNLDFNGSLSRTHYDVRDAHMKCNVSHNASCQFDLGWQTDGDIVLKLEELVDGSDIYTQCQVRLVFWLCIFVVLPVLTVLPITMLLAYFLCRVRTRTFDAVKRQAQEKRRKRQDKRTLVHSEVIPDDTDGTTIQTDDS